MDWISEAAFKEECKKIEQDKAEQQKADQQKAEKQNQAGASRPSTSVDTTAVKEHSSTVAGNDTGNKSDSLIQKPDPSTESNISVADVRRPVYSSSGGHAVAHFSYPPHHKQR